MLRKSSAQLKQLQPKQLFDGTLVVPPRYRSPLTLLEREIAISSSRTISSTLSGEP